MQIEIKLFNFWGTEAQKATRQQANEGKTCTLFYCETLGVIN